MMKKERTAGRSIFFISIFKKGRSILAVGGRGRGEEDLSMHFSAQRLADLALAGCMPHRIGISVWTLTLTNLASILGNIV